MKVVSQSETSDTKAGSEIRPPVQVAMHVLACARSDGRVLREAMALVEHGWAVSIVDIEDDISRPVEEQISGIEVKHLLLPGWFDYSSRSDRWFLFKALRLLIGSILQLLSISADIYHAHEVKALPACFVAATLRRKPLIFDAHELPAPEARKRWRGLSLLTRLMLRASVPHCAGVITVSPPIAQEIRGLFHRQDVVLVRNVPAYQAVAKSDRLRQQLGLSPGTRIALYQGNIQANRQLDKLIRAAAYLERDIVIVIMGRCAPGEPLQEQLEDLIRSEGVEDRVKIIPPVPYKDLLDWTSSADIGLIVYSPNFSRNVQMCLPNKLFEFLMAGLPVLASQLDAVAEIVTGYDVGRIVSPLDSKEVGAAINAMLADREALVRMRHNALDAAQREFHWEKERDQLLHLYHDILSRRKKPWERGLY